MMGVPCRIRGLLPRLAGVASARQLACYASRLQFIRRPELHSRIASRGLVHHHTPKRVPQSSMNDQLYLKMFQPFGVTLDAFKELMSHGEVVRVGQGGVIVKGGEKTEKLTLIVRGSAVAHEDGKPVHKYVGKLTAGTEEVLSSWSEDDFCKVDVVQRGFFIGGSALVDNNLRERAYPYDVVASVQTQIIQWDMDELKQMTSKRGLRGVQASFYYFLYAELISTLGRAPKLDVSLHLEKDEESTDSKDAPGNVTAPTRNQLFKLGIFVAVPFFGFGFADNFLMILCGDFIDAKFGAVLGLSTMACAGLGNWVSDTVGLGLGDAIERAATRIGLSNGRLTAAQELTQRAKFTTLAGKIIGITLGCFAGMCPLMLNKKTEIAEVDQPVYEGIFKTCGVSEAQFLALMEKASRRRKEAGATIVPGGQRWAKIILVVKGEANAYLHADTASGQQRSPMYKYIGKLQTSVDQTLSSEEHSARQVASRGSIIGGTVFNDRSRIVYPYPNDVVAVTDVEWLEWDFEDLDELVKSDVAIRASVFSLLYDEILTSLRADRPQSKIYHALLSAVVADGFVAPKERSLVREYRISHKISEQDHLDMLAELGWTSDGWSRGWMDSGLQMQAVTHESGEPVGAKDDDLLWQLEQAHGIIESVLQKARMETQPAS